MSTIIERLARWAADLNSSEVPVAIAQRARLQHLSVAGAVRAVRQRPVARALRRSGPSRGTVPVVTGGTAPRRSAVALHAGLSSYLDHDDYLFMGHTGHGAVTAAWGSGRRHTLEQVITATVAANEIAGRVGASLLFGPGNGQGWAAVPAVAAAVAAGLLDGLEADALGHAIALALVGAGHVPPHLLFAGGQAKAVAAAGAAVRGIDAVDMAGVGVQGPLDLLDKDDGFYHGLAWVPLRNAFTGLGQAWLTETLAYKLTPGCAYLQPAVEGVLEILDRHVKAADKPLRPDQIDRIEIGVGATGWMLDQMVGDRPMNDPASIPFSITRSVAVAVVGKGLGPQQLEAGWLSENAEAIDLVASKVSLEHHWHRTMALLDQFTATAAPLLAGLSMSQFRIAAAHASHFHGGRLPRPRRPGMVAILKARPDALFERLRRAQPDLATAHLDQWRYRFDAKVELFTTRGGRWPERRTLPNGSPGWPWDQTVAGVLSKHGGADARELLDAQASTDAADWVQRLLA